MPSIHGQYCGPQVRQKWQAIGQISNLKLQENCMSKTDERPDHGSIIHMQQSAIRETRKAQSALSKGVWVDAIVRLTTAQKYAKLGQELAGRE